MFGVLVSVQGRELVGAKQYSGECETVQGHIVAHVATDIKNDLKATHAAEKEIRYDCWS